MTARDLYEELKAACDYLGPGVRGMSQVKVTLEDGALRMASVGRECRIRLPASPADDFKDIT